MEPLKFIRLWIFALGTFMLSNNLNAQPCECSFSFPSCSLTSATKPRALTVDHFLSFYGNVPGGGVMVNYTILGDDHINANDYQEEDDLLDYALNNNFSELILYDVEKILKYPNWNYNNNSLKPTYLQHLIRFITKAKGAPYYFTISAFADSKEDAINAAEYTGLDFDNMECELENTGNIFRTVNNNYTDPEDKDELSHDEIVLNEYVEFAKRVYNYNNCWLEHSDDISGCDVADISSSCANTGAEIDRIVFEFEFWNNPSQAETNPSQEDMRYDLYYKVLQYLWTCIKPFGVCPIAIDTYVGWFHLDTYDNSDQIEFIETHSDRVLLHAYRCNPSDLGPITWGRMDLFGTSSISHSNIWPLFSAESKCNGQPNKFLGDFFNQGGTMACAEDEFQGYYDTESLNQGWDNDINGYAWFSSSFMMANNCIRPIKYILI